jgi:hypothetical protein
MAHSASDSRGRGCLKFGCIGCIGIVAMILLIGGAIVALALLLGNPEEEFRSPNLTQALPAPAGEPSLPSTDTGTEAFPEVEASPSAATPGRVVLDLSMGSFEIVAGPPGEPMRVEGRYDEGSYELKQELIRDAADGWEYRLSFGRDVSWIRGLFQSEGSNNRIKLIIPRGLPFELLGRIGIGESELELGGLSVTETRLEMGTGAHRISFDEPLPAPMGRFELDTSIGELEVARLGNASPDSVEVGHSIGETTVDLRGAWQADATIDVTCGIGECTIRVPDLAAIDLVDASVWLGETNQSVLRRLPKPGEQDLPVLELNVAATIGEVALVR